MTRQVVLDTETTGLQHDKGHRVVEIGCIELLERRPSGRTFHTYLDPERDMDAGAVEVTGLTRDFLSDKPRFASVAESFLEFIRGAELVIHNASFDLGFLDAELGRLTPPVGATLDHASGVLDTLGLARQRFPGQRNSLDALCKRLGVSNAHRHLHGALLDAELLVDVYLALTSGQSEFALATIEGVAQPGGAAGAEMVSPLPPVVRRSLSEAELARHQARLVGIAKKAEGRVALWTSLACTGAGQGNG